MLLKLKGDKMEKFNKLIGLLQQRDFLLEEIEKEKNDLCVKALAESDLKIGDKIKYGKEECILSSLYVSIDKQYSTKTYNAKISFKAKKIKKDGSASLHDFYAYNPNFSDIEKIN